LTSKTRDKVEIETCILPKIRQNTSFFILSLRLKKVLHKLAALGFEHSCGDGGLGMEGTRCQQMKTALVIRSTINYAGYLGPPYRSGTHGAGFNSDIECAVGKVFTAKGIGSGGDGLHLGMGSNIAKCLGEIVGTRNYTVLAYYYCPNGYLACLQG
jgi:hypothetical protein